MTKLKPFDKFFASVLVVILILGLLVFLSASLGVLAKNESKFYSILFSQIVLGLGVGLTGLYFASRIPFEFWRKNSGYIFIISIIITALVFVPALSLKHGGATRWISLGFFSFQPAEILKIAFVMYFSAWLSWYVQKKRGADMSILMVSILFLCGVLVLILQPDTKSVILMIVSAIAMFFVSGLPIKKLVIICIIAILGFTGIIFSRDYVKERIVTYLNPSNDPKGASYQIRQAQIAIGSGGVFGRGFGQSVQKFSYLPEPQGDSIFAVIGEEMGFIGTSVFIFIYLMFTLRGLRIANNAPDLFSKLLVTGLITLICFQSFLNMASLTGVFPLTGVPLVFVSQGGTSLMFSLIAVGIILNVSRYAKK